jgi:biotin transport system substrate-specific component
LTALAQSIPRPRGAARLAVDAGLVLTGSLVVAALAQVELHLTPYVPVTGQTLGVLVVGAALGWARGGLSMLLYIAEGALGLPFFAGGESFVPTLAFPTGGYIWGFVAAAGVVGYLAERGWDRTLGGAIGAMFVGEVIILACGVPWLAASLGMPAEEALAIGLYPFIIGDAIKLLLAAGALPLAWRLVGRR